MRRSDVREPNVTVSGVRKHYAQLAPTYGARANAACARAYSGLVRRALGSAQRVLEIGAGTSTLLPDLNATSTVAMDLSLPMLEAQSGPITWERVVGDGQAMPFKDSAFDGVYAVNVLEHVPDPQRLTSEVGRLLSAGGRFVSVTPNGDLEGLLDVLEQLRLKLPEGPHRFLGFKEMAGLAGNAFRTLEHRRFLALPAGPASLVTLVDRLLAGSHGRGLFQYVVFEKRGPDSD